MKTNQMFLLAAALMLPAALHAQSDTKEEKIKADSTETEGKEVKNRNVMLNASSDNQPRQISIGLPSTLSTPIWEDGMPVSYYIWPCLPYLTWASSSSHENQSLRSLGESAVTAGEVSYAVMSNTRTGKDKFEGHANFTTNIYGLQRYDLNVAGPLGKGWYYSLGAYANLDPGTNKLADVRYQNDMKMFKAALTKRWNDNRGEVSLFYRYANTRNLSDSYGPFIYVGDGSVKEYNGFDLGRDGFLPENGQITYLNVMTGEEETYDRKDGSYAMNNSFTFDFKYHFLNGMKLNVVSKYNYGSARMTTLSLSGVGEATESSGYTYAYDTDGHSAGDTYTGYYNSRYLLHDIGFERDWLTTAELTGKSANLRHNWRLGANIWWNRSGIQASTGVYAHTVESDPVWLKHDGKQEYTANTGGEYYDAYETKFAVYASDDWKVSNRFSLTAGLRLEYYTVGGKNAMAYLNATDTEATYPENERTVNWSLADGTITRFSKHWVNPSATLNFHYNLWKGGGLLGEYVYVMQHPNSQDFAGAYMPVLNAVNIHFGRLGVYWNTPWMQLVSQATIISQSNYKSRTQFTNPNDASDVVTVPITYTVQTMGWTTDVVLTPFKGFQFHGLLTLQDPKYKDFVMTPTFSDGTSKTYDFSDKTTTGVSKTIIELDPSYSFWKLRVWASFRYQSKQYINKANTLYFNGRWETFAGIHYQHNKNLGFDVNFVNLFNEKGCSGSISAADLLEDVSAYKNYLMAGTYIRPFTVEFSAHLDF